MKHVITIPGVPTPWARTAKYRGRSITPAGQINAQGNIAQLAALEWRGRELLGGPVALSCIFRFTVPKRLEKQQDERRFWKTSRPDIDNLVKQVSDALNGIVWRDDAVVCSLSADKCFDTKPSTTIVIEEMAADTAPMGMAV